MNSHMFVCNAKVMGSKPIQSKTSFGLKVPSFKQKELYKARLASPGMGGQPQQQLPSFTRTSSIAQHLTEMT